MRSISRGISLLLKNKQPSIGIMNKFFQNSCQINKNISQICFTTRFNFTQQQQQQQQQKIIDEYTKNLQEEQNKQHELVNMIRIGKLQDGITGMEKLIQERQKKYGEIYPNMEQDYFFLGVSYLDNKNFQKSEDYLNKGMDYCLKTKNLSLLQGFYCSKSQLYLAQKNYEEAIKHVENAYNLALEDQNIYALRALQLASQIHLERGDMPKAIEACEFGLQNVSILMQKFNSIEENLYVQYKLCVDYQYKFEQLLGHCKLNVGKKEEGEKHIKSAQEIKVFLDGLNKMADGLYLLQMSKNKEAIEHLEAAKTVLQDKKNFHLLSYLILLWNLGKVGIMKGEFTYGLQYVEEGLNLIYKEQNQPNKYVYDDIRVDLMNLQCELLINMQNFNEAIKICKQALSYKENNQQEDDRKLATLVIQSVAYWYQSDFKMVDQINDQIISISSKLYGETHDMTKGFIERKQHIKQAAEKKTKQ